MFACVAAWAIDLYQHIPHTVTPTCGTTNTLDTPIDVTAGNMFSVDVSFTGIGANKTTSLIGVTNTAGGTNGQTITLTLGGTSTIYTWTNSVTTNVSVLSNQASLLKIGITNIPTNGQSFAITINGNTNTYTWTNTAQAGSTSFVQTNDIGGSATNLYQFLISQPIIGDLFTVTQYATNGVQIVGRALDTLSNSVSANWATNLNSTVYLTTNTVTTNAHQILVSSSPGGAATNLYTTILADYSGSATTNRLLLSYYNTNGVQFVTPFDAGLLITNGGGWCTNQNTTNSITGNLVFKASNSFDRVTWYRDAARDFTIAYSGTSAVSTNAQFTNVGPAGYWTYGVENANANYAYPNGIQLYSTVKPGF